MVADPRSIGVAGEIDEAVESNDFLAQIKGRIAGLKAIPRPAKERVRAGTGVVNLEAVEKQRMQAVAEEIAAYLRVNGTDIDGIRRVIKEASSDRRLRDQLAQAIFINYFKNLDIHFMVNPNDAQMISKSDVINNLNGYTEQIQELEKKGTQLTKRTKEVAVNTQLQESYIAKIVSVAVTRIMQGIISAEDMVSYTRVGDDRGLLWSVLAGAAEARKNGATPIGAIMSKIKGGLKGVIEI